MKLQIPGQLNGPETGKVMPVAIKIRRELESDFEKLDNTQLEVISPILRVGGTLGDFGKDCIENVKVENKSAECCVVFSPRDWNKMSEAQIYSVIRPPVIKALSIMLAEAELTWP